VKICIETFGCRLNRAESLDLEAAFLAAGWTRAETHRDADMIVVRCCAVTARAQANSERLVAHLKRKYPAKRVVVAGCTKSRANLNFIPPEVSAAATASAADAPLPSRTARAYLKVQDGCSGACSFCIVPKFRGAPVSYGFAPLVDRAKRLADSGYGEIVLTGCNLSLYSDSGKGLADLVGAVADAAPGCRVRVSSVEPGPAAKDVVAAMREKPNVCRFLHMPVQSGSNRILSAMRRQYLLKDAESVMREAAETMPGIGLGCDIIAGFPGETESDHGATLALLHRLPFTNVHVFPFSARPGTVAAALPGQLSHEIRHARAHEIAALAVEKRSAFAKRFRGRKVEIVVEDQKSLGGWTAEYLWCEAGRDRARNISAGHPEKYAPRKSRLAMFVREVRGDTLTGDPV